MLSLTKNKLELACIELSAEHIALRHIYDTHGLPPLWDRKPGFSTLLQIILEQQVSLASAKACFDKLTATLGHVSPENVLLLSDLDLKTVGFSRQKTAYARNLAEAVLERRIDLDGLHILPDAAVKSELIKLKGVGEWTSDIYTADGLVETGYYAKGRRGTTHRLA